MYDFVTCRLMGGLGNNLFQLSAAYSLSLRDNKLFIGDYTDSVTTHTKHTEYFKNIFRKINFKKNFKPNTIFYENSIEFSEIPHLDGSVKLFGYFASEKYFKKYRKEILSLFEIDDITNQTLNKKYSELIQNTNTCSIHVRRGDYLDKQDYHKVQEVSYYMEAYNLMGDDKKYLIFSDDIKWCEINLDFIKDKIFIKNNKDYEDLYLMSLCKNNIMGNSTFSWWGSWLNTNNEKKIISPKDWFGPKYEHIKINDIFCENWIIL